jgi:chaperonin GroES
MLHPIRDRVVVALIDADAATHGPSKLVLANAAIDKMRRGRVVAAGEGFLTTDGKPVPLTVKAGDVVVFAEDVGDRLYSFGQQYIILRESSILAVEVDDAVSPA